MTTKHFSFDKFENPTHIMDILNYVWYASEVCIPGNPFGYPPEIGFDKIYKSDFREDCFFFLPPMLDIFAQRYNNEELSHTFKYANYQSNDNIQELVADLGLDKDKFWFLILFAFDFSSSVCFKGITMKTSAYDQMNQFMDIILPRVQSFDNEYGTTLDREIELSIKIEGEKKCVKIDNPTAIHFLANACKEQINKHNIDEHAWLNHRPIYDNPARELKDSPLIFFFANIFLKFFDTQESVRKVRKKGAKHSVKERFLISQLIYYTRISKHEGWITDDNLLKSYLKQYKESDFWDRTSSVYPEFRP